MILDKEYIDRIYYRTQTICCKGFRIMLGIATSKTVNITQINVDRELFPRNITSISERNGGKENAV